MACSVKSNAEWFPKKERAVAQGIFNTGASIGSVIAPPLIAVLWVAFGWKITFVLIGAVALLWIIPWLIINKAGPKEHPWVTEEEKKYILDGQSELDNMPETRGLSFREILSYRESWAVLIGRLFMEPLWWFFVGWMRIYLADVYGFNVKEIGFFAWIPYVGAAIGSVQWEVCWIACRNGRNRRCVRSYHHELPCSRSCKSLIYTCIYDDSHSCSPWSSCYILLCQNYKTR